MNTYLNKLLPQFEELKWDHAKFYSVKKVSNSLADRHLWFDASIIIDCRM